MIDKVRPRPGGITLVQGLTNGFYRKEAEDFSNEIFPLDLEGKYISDLFKKAYDWFLFETKDVTEDINDAKIREYITQKWIECMTNRSSNPQKSNIILEEVNKFVEDVLNVVKKNQTVQGVKIFR
jgi:hypothetical protein